MPSKAEINEFMTELPDIFLPEKATNLEAVIQLNLTGDNGGSWWVKVDKGTCTADEGTADEKATMTLTSSADDLHAVLTGEANAVAAFMQGKIKVAGDMSLALKMQTMFDFDAV